MQFSIRDLLWATVVAALLTCLVLERRARMTEVEPREDLSGTVRELQRQLVAANSANARLYRLANRQDVTDTKASEAKQTTIKPKEQRDAEGNGVPHLRFPVNIERAMLGEGR